MGSVGLIEKTRKSPSQARPQERQKACPQTAQKTLMRQWQQRGLGWHAARLLASLNLSTDEEVRKFGGRALFLTHGGGRKTVNEIVFVVGDLGKY